MVTGYQIDHYENGIFDINFASDTPGTLDSYLQKHGVSAENIRKFVSNKTQHGVSKSRVGHNAYNEYVKKRLDKIAKDYELDGIDSTDINKVNQKRKELIKNKEMEKLKNEVLELNKYLRKKNQDGIDLYIKNSKNQKIQDYNEAVSLGESVQEKYEKENFSDDKCIVK